MLGIFLDTETNGLNCFTHKVLEIAFSIVDLRTGELKEEFHSLLCISKEGWEKSDLQSLQVNGFSFEETLSGKSPEEVGLLIEMLFRKYSLKRGNSVFICQNPSFDRAFFSQLISPIKQEDLLFPYHWLDLASMFWKASLDSYKEGLSKAPWEIGLSKDKIADFYKIPPEEKPHRARNGVLHLLLCYQAVVGFPAPLIKVQS